MDEHLRRAPVGVLRTTTDGVVTASNDAATDLLETPRDALEGAAIREAFPAAATGTVGQVFRSDPPEAESFEEYYPPIDRWLAVDVVPADGAVTVYLRDCTERHADRQRIERLERRLGRMEAIDTLVATVLRRIVEAPGEEALLQTVCDRLGDTDLYEFVWVGRRDPGGGTVRMTATAGDAPELRDAIDGALRADGTLPEHDAVADGRSVTVPAIAEDGSVPRDVRVAAFGRGLQSCTAIPLVHQGSAYGVIGVYSGRRDGFGEQERASLATLGTIAGFAIKAARQEGLLFAETVTELALEVTDDAIPFVDVGGASLSLTGAVPRQDGSVVCYLRAGEAPDVLDALDGCDAVADARWIDADAGRVEVAVEGTTPVAILATRGTAIRSAEYDDRTARIEAVVPPDVEPRRLVEAIDAAFEQVDVRRKTETAPDVGSLRTFRSELTERLTERQRTVLRTAYLAEYFASPRGSTSEEVADALDITGPTVLYHLRRAQQTLLDVYFETDPP